jgi:hypothetical protein
MGLSVRFEIEIWLENFNRSSQQQRNKSSDTSLAGLGKFMLQGVGKKLTATIHFNIIISVVVILAVVVLVVIHRCGQQPYATY